MTKQPGRKIAMVGVSRGTPWPKSLDVTQRVHEDPMRDRSLVGLLAGSLVGSLVGLLAGLFAGLRVSR